MPTQSEVLDLTPGHIEILEAMDDGHIMVFSQDGDDAWLWPKHTSGFLNDALVIGLRKAGYIETAPYDDEEHVRFGPPTVITEAGLAALRALSSQETDNAK